MTKKTDDRENAAILAGLRLLQAMRENRLGTTAQIDRDIDDVESDGGSLEVLSVEEIDDLCERINSGEITA